MYPEDVHHESVGNILREAALYSALVAVGGSWVTFVRETVLILMPGSGVGAEALAVMTTTGFGILVSLIVAWSWTCLESKQAHHTEIVSPVLCDRAGIAQEQMEAGPPRPTLPEMQHHRRPRRQTQRGITTKVMDRRMVGSKARSSRR